MMTRKGTKMYMNELTNLIKDKIKGHKDAVIIFKDTGGYELILPERESTEHASGPVLTAVVVANMLIRNDEEFAKIVSQKFEEYFKKGDPHES